MEDAKGSVKGLLDDQEEEDEGDLNGNEIDG